MKTDTPEARREPGIKAEDPTQVRAGPANGCALEKRGPDFLRYLRWLGSTCVLVLVVLLTILGFWGEKLPPPPFTGSLSFDEKAVWLTRQDPSAVRFLAIGSSMTVNNLDSEVFRDRGFLNVASWGMKMAHTDAFLEVLLGLMDPETVLVITAPTDFERDYRGRDIFDAERLNRFFRDKNLVRAHLERLSIDYLVSMLPSVLRDRHGRGTYYSLDFDAGGSIPLDLVSEGFARHPERWGRPVAKERSVDSAQYEALRAMAARCRARGIDFILVQGPIREDVLTEADRDFLKNRHWPRLAAICREEGGRFFNFHGALEVGVEDFADSTHLNRQGAQRLSRAILDGLDAMGTRR